MKIEEYRKKGLSFSFSKEEGFRDGIYYLQFPKTEEGSRRKGAELTEIMGKLKAKEGNISLLEIDKNFRRSFIEGILLSDYKFQRYKGEREKEAAIYVKGIDGVGEESKIRDLVFFVRDLVNDAPEKINPKSFSEIAGKIQGVEVFVGDKKWLKENGFNGTLAVGKGSSIPPRVVIYRYSPEGARRKIALVGKGVTFDSGGLDLKSPEYMKDMHMDMAGAAVVLGIAKALKDFPVKDEIIGIMPLAENLPSSSSYKPYDVLQMDNGKTVEINNTDAEGRLLLADGLIYAEKQGADIVIDLATLTGAAIVALGELVAALYSTDEEEGKKMEKASEKTGEKVWRMPLVEDYRDELKSQRADIKNSGYKRSGGSIMAALFLSEFIERPKWLHLDIAGPAMIEKPFYYMSSEGTGFGTRLLLEYLRGEK